MDGASFGAFQQQITRNQEELKDYLKDLDSWKTNISKKDEKLRSTTNTKTEDVNYPPVRNSLHKKKKIKKRKSDGKRTTKQKPARIPGHDFRAWDKFDVEKALEEVEQKGDSESSYEEDTDEEWEEERMKQQAVFEKDQGNDFYKKNKLNEAIECYTKGINCDPTNAVLYANRAMALLKQEKYGAVEQDCTDAIALDPTYIKAYMRRGTARHKLRKHQSALDDYKQVVKLEPDNKMAQREVATLEQELKISAEGIVIPVKKNLKERSKNPRIRIEIQEIDHDDVKLKLNSAVAKTTALQSEEKKRIVAQDNELFNKYLTHETRTKTRTGKHNDDNGDLIECRSPAHTISSPSDIGRLNLAPVAQSNADKDRNQKSPGSAEQSPRTSPRAPANSYQFQRDWKTVKNDMDKAYEYLKLIPASDLPKLIGEFLEADVMKMILTVFQHRFLRDGVDILGHMLHLAKVKRFAMITMFMSNTEKEDRLRPRYRHYVTSNDICSPYMKRIFANPDHQLRHRLHSKPISRPNGSVSGQTDFLHLLDKNSARAIVQKLSDIDGTSSEDIKRLKAAYGL